MRTTVRFKGFFLILLAVLAVGIGARMLSSSAYRAKQDARNAKQVELNRLQSDNQGMRNEIEQMDSADYIVASAMTDYAYMSKDGLRFEFTNPEALYEYTVNEMKIMMDELNH